MARAAGCRGRQEPSKQRPAQDVARGAAHECRLAAVLGQAVSQPDAVHQRVAAPSRRKPVEEAPGVGETMIAVIFQYLFSFTGKEDGAERRCKSREGEEPRPQKKTA